MTPLSDLITEIDHWGEKTPDKIAHISGDRSLTFGALRQQSDALAQYLDKTLGADRSPVCGARAQATRDACCLSGHGENRARLCAD